MFKHLRWLDKVFFRENTSQVWALTTLPIGDGVISLLWQLRCRCNPGHNKFSSLSHQKKTWELGIDPEKPYRAFLKGPLIKMFRKDAPYDSIFLIYKIFRENVKTSFCFSYFFY